MIASRAAAARQLRVATQQLPRTARHARFIGSSAPAPAPKRGGGKAVGFITVFAVAAAASYWYPQIMEQLEGKKPAEEEAKVIVPQAELQFEQPRGKANSQEENRDMLSSQHLQIKQSWEHPGVYVWGSNKGKVVDAQSKDKYIKLPRRLEFFNDQILRDLKLTQRFGAAITEKGDLVQWGLGFSKDDPSPATTLKGKDLAKIEVSMDSIIALSRSGAVYSIPASRDDLSGGAKQSQSKGWSLWSGSSKESVSFRTLTPSLGYGERVTDISSGMEHLLMLTSKGRVFSAAATSSTYPSKGQMGIPGLTWETRPKGPFDQAQELKALSGKHAVQIATGDLHSVVLDKAGDIWTFGDNMFGQLGIEPTSGRQTIDTPTLVPTDKLYKGTNMTAKITSIAAGGLTSFFAVDAEAAKDQVTNAATFPSRREPKQVSDLWAMGQGTYGSLGNGRWTHVSTAPAKVKALSALYEFNEKKNMLSPIKVKSLSVGATHCAAVMGNETQTASTGWTSKDNQTNVGADVLFWGGNEHYQLGTGKRSNLNAPAYIGPLDGGAADAARGRGDDQRLCLAPRQTAKTGVDGKGRKVTLEQKVECGRYVTGVYSSA